ncbi:DUF6213 family protein [Kitasatospora sp. NPDC097643]|uniref:DUF6213 family protein n=1 Tax=Kitasatospora sp. NPDC097643 TaxID=3157230 RepID=UPI003328AD8C
MSQVSMIWGVGDSLVVPADQVTALLRHLGGQWQRWAESEDSDLDPVTTARLVGALRELADQIDVECIGFASYGPPATGDDRR